jgi:acyl phosphate:glycerol-3-phosphate acyltransferase
VTTIAFTVSAYLLGSIPFALLVSRAMGLADPRTYGSRNIGATNVLRSGNRLAALLTLLGDLAKGWAAVLIARSLGASDVLIAIVAFSAFLGHLFPVWLRFRGGKGVATAAGVLIAIDWRLGLAVIVAWLTIAVLSRYSSLAAIVAALFAPVAAWYIVGSVSILAAVSAMSVLLIARHRGNIAKLLRGEESRIGERKPSTRAGAAET